MSIHVRDFVFPIIVCQDKGEYYDAVENYGTGFFIGNSGFGLTAKHIFKQIEQSIKSGEKIVGMFANDTEWTVRNIVEYEFHDTEDVAIFRIEFYQKIQDSIFKIVDNHF